MFEALARIRHRRFRRDLSAYLDEALSPGACRQLEGHLDACAACRRELAELRATNAVLSDLPQAEAPRSFALAAAPERAVSLRPASRRLEFGLRLATATAAFALAVIVIGDFAGLPGDGEKEEATVAVPSFQEAGGADDKGLFSAEREERAADAPAPVGEADEATPPEAGYMPEMAEAPVVEATPESTPAPPPVGGPLTEANLAEQPAEGVEDLPTPESAPPPGLTAPSEGGAVKEVTPDATPAPPVAREPLMETEISDDAAAVPEAIVAEDDGGLSREDVVRWVEIGLGAGVGILVISWAFVLRHVRIRAQSQ